MPVTYRKMNHRNGRTPKIWPNLFVFWMKNAGSERTSDLLNHTQPEGDGSQAPPAPPLPRRALPLGRSLSFPKICIYYARG